MEKPYCLERSSQKTCQNRNFVFDGAVLVFTGTLYGMDGEAGHFSALTGLNGVLKNS